MEETIAGLPVIMLIGLFWLAWASRQGDDSGPRDDDGRSSSWFDSSDEDEEP